MKITKAVIPAAGLGTRVLPVSKAVPKEMLNIVDRPAIQYIVEEAAASGITDILIVTGRGKGVMEDHFDRAFELEENLRGRPDKAELLRQVQSCASLANIYFIRQKETKGLAHAIHCAKNFVGDEPFCILYGDDVIFSEEPVTGQLMRAYEQYGCGAVGVQEVPREDVVKYCTLDVTPLTGRVMAVHRIIEKPAPEQILSRYAILGRALMPPEIFGIIEALTPSPRTGEADFSEAMTVLAGRGKLNAVDFIGDRYDMGSKLGILKANCEAALRRPELGEAFGEYIKALAARLRRRQINN